MDKIEALQSVVASVRSSVDEVGGEWYPHHHPGLVRNDEVVAQSYSIEGRRFNMKAWYDSVPEMLRVRFENPQGDRKEHSVLPEQHEQILQFVTGQVRIFR